MGRQFSPERRPTRAAFVIFRLIIHLSQQRNLFIVQGYCVRCKSKQEMVSATRTLMKNGRRAMIGLCSVCGTKMSVAGKWDTEAAPPSPTTETATLQLSHSHSAE